MPPAVVEVSTRHAERVPLLFWSDGDRVYVFATGRSSRWSVDALRAGVCDLTFAGEPSRSYRASLVTDLEESGRAREGLREKYGADVWSRYFHPPERYVRLAPVSGGPAPTPEDPAESEFDAVAPTYDAAYERQPFERYLKDRAQQWLLHEIEGLDPVLEIGPGTGIDTLPILGAGHRVVAVDLSAGMLRELNGRAELAGFASRLRTVHGPLRDLATLLRSVGPGEFGAACSTFGAFNIERDLDGAARALGQLIRPGGRLVFTSLNQAGVAPLLWEIASGNPVGAAARVGRTVPAGEIRYPLEVHQRGPGFWDRLLAPEFEREVARPVSVMIPPFDSPRLLRWIGRRGARNLRDLDAALSRAPSLVPLSEWVFLSYRRVTPARGSAIGGR